MTTATNLRSWCLRHATVIRLTRALLTMLEQRRQQHWTADNIKTSARIASTECTAQLTLKYSPGACCNPRPVATGRVSCICDWLRDATGLDSGDRSWICNAAQYYTVIACSHRRHRPDKTVSSSLQLCSHHRHAQDKTVMSRPCRWCEQAVIYDKQLTLQHNIQCQCLMLYVSPTEQRILTRWNKTQQNQVKVRLIPRWQVRSVQVITAC